MSHMTNKKRIQRDKNARLRGVNGFNTGTRTMGKTKSELLDDCVKAEIEDFNQNVNDDDDFDDYAEYDYF